MNEKQKEILLLVLKRIDWIVFSILGALLITAIYLRMTEENYQVQEPEQPAPREFDVKFPMPDKPDVKNEAFDRVAKSFFTLDADATKNEGTRRMIQNPMFVLRTAEEQSKARQELNALYNQADRHFQEKKYAESRRLIRQILDQDPKHREAQELNKRLDAVAPAGGTTP